MRRLSLVMFVLSGAAALVFEVALQRSLARAFGVSAFATATVLAAYMAGLALGAVAFGRLADRSASPLRLYAWLELGIGACAAAMPLVVPATIGAFSRLAHGRESDSASVVVGRLALAFAVTLVPTVLMGGTLPAVARALASLGAKSDAAIARLYTANVLGAALGAAAASYLVLPGLGLAGSMWLGAGLNAAAAALGFALARSPRAGASTSPAPTAAATPQPARGRGPLLRHLVAASAWSGLATFAAEVTWFQLLAVVAGTSAYAFGLMLAVFLLGLTLGSAWASRQPDERVDWGLLGRVQLAAAAAFAVTLPLWDRVPSLFALAGDFTPSFASREAVRALACVEVMLVPAAILGAVYPLLLRLAARAPALGRTVGGVAAANTLGAVGGSLLTGFVLLPALGSRGLLLALVGGAAGFALLTLRGRWRLAPVAVAALALLLPPWNLARLAGGANVYFLETPYAKAEVLWAHESVASGLTSVVKSPTTGALTLLTNGKFQGNNSGELDAQRAFVQIPMQFQARWRRALLIGVGTGCSLGTLAAQPWSEVEAAELSFDVIDASRRYFSDVNGAVFSGRRVRVHLADGRNLLLLSDATYDLVSLELSSIWFAGASDLYNRDFYALVKAHLAPDGVLQQWVQLHHLTRRDLAVILQSVRAELPHVALFAGGGQGIVIGSQQPLVLDYQRLVRLSGELSGSDATRGVAGGDLLTLGGKLVLDERGVAALIAEEAKRAGVAPEALVSTDDNLYLEYSTPRGNADDSLQLETLLASLQGLPDGPLPMRGDDTEGARAHARAAFLVGRGDLAGAQRLLEGLVGSEPRARPLGEWVLFELAKGARPGAADGGTPAPVQPLRGAQPDAAAPGERTAEARADAGPTR